jgi:hypothetical protein
MNKIKRAAVLLIFFIASTTTQAQQQLFLGLQSQWGVGITSIEQKKEFLKSKSIPWQINHALSIQYRIADKFSIETGISNNNLIWKIYDKDFKQRYNNRFESNLANKIGHLSYFLNFQYAFKLASSRPFAAPKYIYLQLGGGYHFYGEKTLSQQKDFVFGSEVVETVSMQTKYNKGAYFIAPEIGFQKLFTATLFSAGISGVFNLNKNMFLSNYTSVKPDGTVVTSDKLTATGSYIALNIRFNISLLFKEKKEKPVKIKKKKEKEKEEEVVKPDTVQVKPEPKAEVDTMRQAVNGRDFNVTHGMSVNSRTIQIKVWDNKEIDADSIHLLFNDTWILKNYALTKKPKIIEVQLKDGINNLVLYALNLGKYPPNTAAISVYDGKTWRNIVLESTLDKCGTLQIKYSP